MIRKLLVAYDGSDQSKKAYALALDMAGKYSAQVVILSVARPPEPPAAAEGSSILESASGYFEGHFKVMRDAGSASGVPVRFEVRIGHPAEQIVKLALEEDVDMILMGHRGESFLQKWLLGSVAKRVLSYAHCTVTIVR